MKNRQIPEEIKDLVPDFLARRISEHKNLEIFFLENDFLEISKVAHKLKGNGGGYGFPELSEIGNRLENEAKKNNKENIKTILIELGTLLQELKEEIKFKN